MGCNGSQDLSEDDEQRVQRELEKMKKKQKSAPKTRSVGEKPYPIEINDYDYEYTYTDTDSEGDQGIWYNICFIFDFDIIKYIYFLYMILFFKVQIFTCNHFFAFIH